MSSNKPKPFIAHDKEYIQKLADSLPARDPLEEIHFEYLTEALRAIGITEDPYASLSIESYNPKIIEKLAHDSFVKLSATHPTDEMQEKLLRAWDYLCEADNLEKADLIFVFGSREENCPRFAAKLYKEGWAPKIMFTGCTAAYLEKEGLSEAELFANIAEAEGVPRSAMILETESINTPENVVKGIKILKEQKFQPKKIILVTFARHMRRGYLTFRGVLDWDAKLIRQPVASQGVKRDTFLTDEKIWTYVFFEYIKMYGARLMKHF